MDHADTNQIINTVSWVQENIFSFGLNISRGPDGFVDRFFFLWMGYLGVAFETGGFFFSALLVGMGLFGKKRRQKGKGESKAGVQGGPEKEVRNGVTWDEWGVMSPQ